MKTIEIKVYTFGELPENIKEKVIEKHYDINVNFDWWGFIYEDARNIGLKIKGFDIDRESYVNGEFMLSAAEVAANIFRDHGENCDTYKTAQNFMNEWQPVFNNYMDESHEDYESSDAEGKLIDIEGEFLKFLCNDYLKILSKEYDYQTSKEAIIETIEANEYEFTEDGKMI